MMKHQPSMPKLPQDPTPSDCVAWLRAATKHIGAGFHPDDRPHDYRALNGEPLFGVLHAAEVEHELMTCRKVLESSGIDPCAIAIKVQRRLLSHLLPS